MGIFKEEATVFEGVAKLQTRIWPDSCDMGVLVSDYPGIEQQVKDAITSLKDCLPIKICKWGVEGKNWGITFEVFIPWEVDAGYEVGTTYIITSSYNKKGHYISVDMRSDSRKIT